MAQQRPHKLLYTAVARGTTVLAEQRCVACVLRVGARCRLSAAPLPLSSYLHAAVCVQTGLDVANCVRRCVLLQVVLSAQCAHQPRLRVAHHTSPPAPNNHCLSQTQLHQRQRPTNRPAHLGEAATRGHVSSGEARAGTDAAPSCRAHPAPTPIQTPPSKKPLAPQPHLLRAGPAHVPLPRRRRRRVPLHGRGGAGAAHPLCVPGGCEPAVHWGVRGHV